MPWLLLLACAPVDGPPPCESDETGVISLPADNAPHSDPDEEWAWSGHVEDEDGAWSGDSLRWRVSGDGVQETTSVQASVSNVEGQTYHYETDTASEDIATGEEGNGSNAAAKEGSSNDSSDAVANGGEEAPVSPARSSSGKKRKKKKKKKKKKEKKDRSPQKGHRERADE